MSLRLTILGCHSANPRANAFPTSQYLEMRNHHFLIDCGEGTQQQMSKYKVSFSKINRIFISHLHGDHFFGLIGLVSTYCILNRKKSLNIYGPKGIKKLITLQLKLSDSQAKFPLIFHELSSNNSELIFEDDEVFVKTIPLKHRIYTNGFLFKEKERPKKLFMQNIRKYDEINQSNYFSISSGKDIVLNSGEIIPNYKLTLESPKPLSFAFCSDTIYNPDIIPIIKKVDLLYHESTFLESEKELAAKTKHSTAKDAATIALKSDVKKLILGHYSIRYKDIRFFKKEAERIFINTELAEVKKVFVL